MLARLSVVAFLACAGCFSLFPFGGGGGGSHPQTLIDGKVFGTGTTRFDDRDVVIDAAPAITRTKTKGLDWAVGNAVGLRETPSDGYTFTLKKKDVGENFTAFLLSHGVSDRDAGKIQATQLWGEPAIVIPRLYGGNIGNGVLYAAERKSCFVSLYVYTAAGDLAALEKAALAGVHGKAGGPPGEEVCQ